MKKKMHWNIDNNNNNDLKMRTENWELRIDNNNDNAYDNNNHNIKKHKKKTINAKEKK